MKISMFAKITEGITGSQITICLCLVSFFFFFIFRCNLLVGQGYTQGIVINGYTVNDFATDTPDFSLNTVGEGWISSCEILDTGIGYVC